MFTQRTENKREISQNKLGHVVCVLLHRKSILICEVTKREIHR